jgi:hypothetical protein
MMDLAVNVHFAAAESAEIDASVAYLSRVSPKVYRAWAEYNREYTFSHNAGQQIPDTGGGEIQKHLRSLGLMFS